MATMSFGLLRVAVKHTYIRSGAFHYQRAIPDDLRDRYGSKLVKLNLKTADPAEAASKVAALNQKLEQEWESIRAGLLLSPTRGRELARTVSQPARLDVHIKHVETVPLRQTIVRERCTQPPIVVSSNAGEQPSPVSALSGLRNLYLKNHKKGESSARLVLDTERVVNALVKQCGDVPFQQVSRKDANTFRNDLLAQGLKTATVRRRIATAAAIFATAIRELEVDKANPFRSMQIVGEGRDAHSKEVFGMADLISVQSAAVEGDDDIRWLAALHSDLGCRISDVAGLSLSDLVLDALIPHVFFREDLSRDRTLKTGGIGERKVPLVGLSLWAAQRIVATAKVGQKFAFPRYCSSTEVKGTSASAAVNKWLSGLGLRKTYTSHSFRHTMADRLREVGCPEDIRKAIGGWASNDVAGRYGEGYSLKIMKKWLDKVILVQVTRSL